MRVKVSRKMGVKFLEKCEFEISRKMEVQVSGKMRVRSFYESFTNFQKEFSLVTIKFYLNFDKMESRFHSPRSLLAISSLWLLMLRSVESALFAILFPPPLHCSTAQHTCLEPSSSTTCVTYNRR